MGSRRPDKFTAIQTLCIKRQADAVVPEDFRQIAASSPEDIEIANMRIALQMFLNL